MIHEQHDICKLNKFAIFRNITIPEFVSKKDIKKKIKVYISLDFVHKNAENIEEAFKDIVSNLQLKKYH